MEQEKMKRAREGDEETRMENNNNNNAKKRDVYGKNLLKEVEKEEEGCSEACESHLGLGVFDFPWLKDGVTSKLEDYLFDFEDNFSTFLEHEDASFKASTIDFSGACDLCHTPEPSMPHIPETKLEDIAWKPFQSDMLELKAEDVDCIWSSLLNHPL